jgi:hypothetical protein
MRRLTSFTATLVAALALPAIAQASTGTVLSVSHHHHELQLVSSNKSVHSFSFSGKLAGVTRGTKLSYAASGAHITRARATGTATSFSFLGTVVRSGSGALVLSLGDSQNLRLTSKQLNARSHKPSARGGSSGGKSLTVNINGLQPGETVEVTESTDAAGNVTITITLPNGSGSGSSSGGSGSGGGSESTATGLVNNVNTDSFDIITASGSDLTFHMAASALANVDMSSCDSVVVSYHTAAQAMTADNVVDNGAPNSGTCSDGGSDGSDWVGTVTAVSATTITVDAGAGNGGPQTFSVGDPAITLGYLIGDSVDVSYEQDGSQYVADTISYNDTPTSGVVTAMTNLGAGFYSVTMTDDYSGDSETFYVPEALLDGQDVQIGDDLSVSYYQATRGLTLDYLEDDGPAS